MGGSSHGIQEIIYRLHASRFKVLLAAVKNKCSGREYFEHEGLQISQKHMSIYLEDQGLSQRPASEIDLSSND